MTPAARLALLVLLVPLAACAASAANEAGLKPGVTAQAEAEEPLVPETGSDGLEPSLAGLFLSGKAALAEGRSDQAAAFFARATDLVSETGRPFLKEQAFSASVLAGDIDKAVALAPSATEGNTLNVRLGLLVRAVDAMARDDGAASWALLKGDEIGTPFRSLALLMRPWAAAAAGDIEAATTRPQVRNSDRFTQAFAQFNYALLTEREGRLDESERTYKFLSGDTNEVSLFSLAYGAFLERQGRQADAIAVYDGLLAERAQDRNAAMAKARALAKKPGPPLPTIKEGAAQTLLAAATLALAQNGSDNAITYLRLALKLDPKRTDAQLLVADYLEDKGDLDASRAILTQVPETSADWMGARTRLALSYEAVEDHAKALELARETIKKAPGDVDAQIVLADLLSSAKSYDEAIKVLNRVISAKGDKAEWRLFYSRAVAQQQAGRWSEAEKDLIHALEVQPDQPDVMNYLGYSWADRGENLPEALKMLQKASTAKPNQGAIIDSLGWVHYRMGEYPKAVEYLEKAAELSPADIEVNDHLGDAYAKIGRTLEAEFQWRRVLTLRPDEKQKAAIEAKLAAVIATPRVATAPEATRETP